MQVIDMRTLVDAVTGVEADTLHRQIPQRMIHELQLLEVPERSTMQVGPVEVTAVPVVHASGAPAVARTSGSSNPYPTADELLVLPQMPKPSCSSVTSEGAAD